VNADSYFEIGTSHRVCEDYALHGIVKTDRGPLAYGIVSDGCSSGVNTDVGARIIAHETRRCLEQFATNSWQVQEFVDQNPAPFLLPAILHGSWQAAFALGLSQHSLLASLWVMVAYGDRVFVSGWGDGSVITKSGDEVLVIAASYSQEAPCYPIFYLSEDMRKRYEEKFPDQEFYLEHWTKSPLGPKYERTVQDLNKPYIGSCNTLELDSITITTDGIGTFLQKHETGGTEGKDTQWIAEQIAKFKNPAGEFLKRRMNRFSRDCAKDGIAHYDDFGCASIILTGDK